MMGLGIVILVVDLGLKHTWNQSASDSKDE